jgi:hypothetical protein
MHRIVLASLPFFVAVGCTPQYDVAVSWSIAGVDSLEQGCALADAEKVRVTAESRTRSDDEPSMGEFEFDCASGEGIVQSGNMAKLAGQLLRGGKVVGSADTVDIEPAGSNVQPIAVAMKLKVHTGILEANLRVAGQDCGSAGASNFNVSLYRSQSGLDNLLLEENVSVSCSGSTAVYTNNTVQIGGRHTLIATTNIGGLEYKTETKVTQDAIRVGVDVDLVADQRPASHDAGPNNLPDTPITPSDAGPPPADAGPPPADAGPPPADAGPPAMDSGSADTDSGVVASDSGAPSGDGG